MLCLYIKFRFSLSYREIEELVNIRWLKVSFSYTKMG